MTPDRVPSGWRSAKYGDAMTEADERAGDRLGLPVLSVTKTRGPMLASERFGKALHSRDLSRYRVAHRDVIVADPMLLWDGSIGTQGVVDAGLVSPDYRVYAPSDQADPAFLAYVVRSPTMLPYYQGGARGTNVRRNRIARADFLAIPLALPPLSEQRKIARILACADEAIETTQSVIDQLGVAKKAMMAELLTRGLPGRHTRFKPTEIGEVPEDWDVLTLGAITVESAFGPRFPATEYSPSGNFGTLRTTDVTAAWEIDYSTIPRARLDETQFRAHVLQDHDLLVTRSGTCGVVCVFKRQAIDIIPGAFLIRFRLRPSAQPEFVRLAMMTPATAARVQAMAAGGVQKNLSGTNLSRLALPMPPAVEQAEIVQAVEALDTRLRAESAVAEHLRALKTALVSVLLTGQVRVTPDGEAA